MGISQKSDNNVKTTSLVKSHSISEDRKAKVELLLADDNKVNRIVATTIITRLGYNVDIAENGLEAIELLKTSPYDLVFMDLQMPKMDGIEATRIIRDKKSDVIHHNIPVIAMTAHAMKGHREICINAGMDDYITKPIRSEVIKKMLEKWLSTSVGVPNL